MEKTTEAGFPQNLFIEVQVKLMILEYLLFYRRMIMQSGLWYGVTMTTGWFLVMMGVQ